MYDIVIKSAGVLADPKLPPPVIDAWAALEQLYRLAVWLIVDVWLPSAPAEYQLPRRPQLPGSVVSFLQLSKREEHTSIISDVLWCLSCVAAPYP